MKSIWKGKRAGAEDQQPPAQSAPAQSAPAQSAPAQSTPAQSAPAQSEPAAFSNATPQQFAPAGYPQTYDNFKSLPRDVVPFNRRWHTAKVALGIASIVTSVIVISLGIALVASYGNAGETGFGYADVDLICIAAVGGVAFIWQVSENITLCVRSAHRGIHPGAHVGMHLLISIGAAISVVFMSFFLSSDVAYLQNYACETESDYCDDEYDFDPYNPTNLTYGQVQSYVAIEAAALAFMGVLMVLHLILFVRACVETHQRNRIGGTIVLIPGDAPLSGAGGTVYHMATPRELANWSRARAQPQMGQQPMQSMQPMPAGYSTGPNTRELHGYYAPRPAEQKAALAPQSDQAWPLNSAVSSGPAHGSREPPAERGAMQEVTPEEVRASPEERE